MRDLFGNMPVRVRQRASEPAANDKEWQSLRKCIVGLLLAWPHGVSITLRNSISTQNMKIRSTPDPKELRQADVNHVCSILSQVMFITPSDKEFWVSTTASTSHLIISGTMSIEPCPHKSVQFISFHVHPIADSNGCNFLYDHINRLFATSSFGNEEEDESSNDAEARKGLADARFKQDGYTSRQLKSSKKGSNKWPMFCLKIESRDVASSLGEVDDFLDEKRGHMTSVMDLLEAMVVGFLKEHHFRVESRNRSGRRIGIRDSHTAKLPQVTNKSKMVSTRKYTPSYGKHARMNLGTDIKLPSFSRGSTDSLESSFGTWTRVKRGQMGTTQKTVDMSAVSSTDGVYLEPGGSSVPKPTFPSAPDQSSRETVAGRFFAPRNKNSVRHYGDHASKFYASGDIRAKSVEASAAKSTPLVGVDGKVSRLPFEFENHTPSEKNNATKPTGMDPPMPSDSVESPDDNFVSWIDPISKARSLICGRTGLVVTPQKLMTVQDSDSSLNTFRPHTLSSGTRPNLRTTGRAREEPSTWISGLLNSWDNPVFQPAELPIPQLSIDSPNIESQQIMHGRQHKCSHSDIDNAFRQSSGGPTGRLTKDALRNAEVISQVDKKFILIKISTTENQDFSDAGMSGPSLLVLVDQHAADERCRVEELFHELCTNTVPLAVQPPICFDVSDLELRQFRRNVDHFRNWGISYEIFDASKSTGPGHQVTVQGLPSVIIEGCRIEPKVLVKLMRTDIWNAYHRGDDKQQTGRPLKMSISDEPTRKWFNKLRECPAGLLDMLNSRSCRSTFATSNGFATNTKRWWHRCNNVQR